MYCPRCGTLNSDDAKFCRACGADLSLVPQALAGKLPAGAYALLEVEEEEGEGKKGRKVKFKEPPTLEKGLENVFTGVAFLIVFMLALFFYKGAFMFWVWLIIPALGYLGDGLGQVIRARRATAELSGSSALSPLAFPPASEAHALPPRQTSEIVTPPASVTEGTTRHLGAPAERPTKDA